MDRVFKPPVPKNQYMERGTNTSILLAVIAASLLLFGGILRDIGEDIPLEEGMGILRRVKNLLSDSIRNGVTVRRDLKFNGSVEHNEAFVFEEVGPEEIGLEYYPEETDVSVDGKRIAVEGQRTNIRIKKFRGSLEISNETVTLVGDTELFSSDTTAMENGFMEVSVNGTYETVDIVNIRINELDYGSPVGVFDIGRSITTTLNGNPTTVHAFYGNMSIQPGKSTLSGDASRIRLGNHTISAS